MKTIIRSFQYLGQSFFVNIRIFTSERLQVLLSTEVKMECGDSRYHEQYETVEQCSHQSSKLINVVRH